MKGGSDRSIRDMKIFKKMPKTAPNAPIHPEMEINLSLLYIPLHKPGGRGSDVHQLYKDNI